MYYLISHKDFKISIMIFILKIGNRLRETKISFCSSKRCMNSYVNNL